MERPTPSAEVLQQYQGLKLSDAGSDFFIADSSRVVLKLLASDIPVESILATAEWYAENQHQIFLKQTPIAYQVPIEVMQSIVGYSLHHGVMARARRPQDASLADLLTGPILVMDGIAKTDNVGAIIRNAAAFGITNILVDHRTCHPFQRRAVRTSMGNVYGMKIHQTRNLAADLLWLKSQGVQVVGFENRPSAVNLGELQFTSKTALIIGSEATGMSPEVMATVNQLVRIPIDEDVYALNAACASAVALYAFKENFKPA